MMICAPPNFSRPSDAGSRRSSTLRPRHPCLPQPQLQTSPSTVIARLCEAPAATNATLDPPNPDASRDGTMRSATSPSPSLPQPPHPKLQTSPSSVSTSVWRDPHDTITTCAPPNTSGASRVGAVRT